MFISRKTYTNILKRLEQLEQNQVRICPVCNIAREPQAFRHLAGMCFQYNYNYCIHCEDTIERQKKAEALAKQYPDKVLKCLDEIDEQMK